MNETTTLGLVFAAVGAVLLALLGVVWAMLQGRLAAVEVKMSSLETQNTGQETAIGRLTERMTAREEVHAQHREDMQTQFQRIDAHLSELNRKLDRLLGGGTPYPTRYGQRGGSGSEPEKR